MTRELQVRLGADTTRLVSADTLFLWRVVGGTGVEPPWQQRLVVARYEPTNDLVNRLSAAIAAQPLHELRHRGVGLWQFLPSYIWPELHRARELVSSLAALVDELSPERLCVLIDVGSPSARLWDGAGRSVAAARSLPLTVRRTWGLALDRKRLIVERLLRGRAEVIARQLRNLRVSRRKAVARPGRHLLYVTHVRTAGPEPFGADRWDEQLSPLLEPLEMAGWVVTGLDCPYGSRRAVAAAVDRRPIDVPSVQWATFDGWSRPRLPRRGAARQLLGAPSLRAALVEEGISLVPALAPTLRRAGVVFAAECASLLDTAGRILDDVRPTAILATYESGPYQRALLIEAARRGIPSLGLQHGTIFDNNYDYVHDDVVPAGTGEHGFVVPDRTAVWSGFWADVLTDAGSYPPDAIAVTGNWRHDRPVPAQAQVRGGLGIDGSRPVVTILPGWPDPVDFLDRCLAPCRALGLDVIVKPHPMDDPAAMRSLLDRRGWSTTRILDRLPPALIAADVVISGVTTAIAEAMLYDRPIVVFAEAENQTVPFFVEAGACMRASEPEDLESALRTLLHDEDARSAVRAAGQVVAQRLFGPLDGLSAQRVVDVLDSLASSA